MCTVDTPDPVSADDADPEYLRNPWLDGTQSRSSANGRSSLRIARGSGKSPLTIKGFDQQPAELVDGPVRPGIPGGGGGGGNVTPNLPFPPHPSYQPR